MKRLTLLAAVFLASSALADCAHDVACLTWEHDLKRVDGSALTNLAGFRVVYGSSPDVLHQAIDLNNPGLRAYNVVGLAAGRYYFGVEAFDTDGVRSGVSNVVTKTILAEPPPNPPAPPVLSVTETTVYQVLGTLDRFTLLPVGTVADGTECIPEQSVNGYHAVPRASVAWYGNVKPQIVVARCGG